MATVAPESIRGLTWLLLGVGALLLAGLVLALTVDHQQTLTNALALSTWTDQQPLLSMLLFVLITALWSVLLPTTPPILLAGFCFGPLWGTLLSTSATTLAFLQSFAIGRLLGADGIEHWTKNRPRARNLFAAVRRSGWQLVFLMRLSPILPFHVQNYLYGAAGLHLSPTLLATVLGKIPNVAMTVFVGSAARQGLAANWTGLTGGIVGIGILTLVWLTWLVRKHLLIQTEEILEASSEPS